MNLNTFKIIAALALLIAVLPLDYAYYELLRVFICGLSAYIAYTYSGSDSSWLWVFGGIAILFNPIVPVHMSKEVWIILDIITAIVFARNVFENIKGRDK